METPNKVICKMLIMHTCTESIKYYLGDNFVRDVSLNSVAHLSWIEHGHGYILRLWRWGSRALHQRPRSTFLLRALISILPILQIERERWTNYHSIIWQIRRFVISIKREDGAGAFRSYRVYHLRVQVEGNRRLNYAASEKLIVGGDGKRLWRSGAPRAWWLLR